MFKARSKELRNVTLGIGAKELKNLDTFSKSDPYLKISVPSPTGGFRLLKTSETKKVNDKQFEIYYNSIIIFGIIMGE